MNKYKIQLYESKHREGDVIEEHSHQHTVQVLYALGGTGSIRLDGRDYEMVQDHVAFIIPCSNHAVISDDRLTLLVLGFDVALMKTELMDMPLIEQFQASSLIKLNRFQGSDLRLLLRKMLHEQSSNETISGFALGVYTQELLLLLARALAAPQVQDANMVRAERIRSYIDTFYYKMNSADDIAAKLGISPRYVNHIFKEKFGMTPKQYVNEVRMKAAQKLLAETEKDIVSICFEVGYDNMATFYRIFKNITQNSPLKYRQSLENRSSTTYFRI